MNLCNRRGFAMVGGAMAGMFGSTTNYGMDEMIIGGCCGGMGGYGSGFGPEIEGATEKRARCSVQRLWELFKET